MCKTIGQIMLEEIAGFPPLIRQAIEEAQKRKRGDSLAEKFKEQPKILWKREEVFSEK